MENKELIEALNELKKSIDSLTAIQQDIYKTDDSFDNHSLTRGKIEELIKSNHELGLKIGSLGAFIDQLKAAISRL